MTTTSSKDRPLISVVTVVYNGAGSIEETIQSVLSLNHPSIEFIVIDGGSTDSTVEIIKQYTNRITYWISEKDKGIYDAMNKGIDAATGRWTIFMNSGDKFASPGCLDKIDWNSDADIIYGEAIKVYPNFSVPFPVMPVEKWWKEMPFCHNASFTSTALLKQWKFDLRYRFSADFDFLYRAYLANKKFIHVNDLITVFDYKQGASIDNGLKSLRERRDSVAAHGGNVTKSLYFYTLIARYKTASFVKKLVGTKLTAWVTRLLRT